MGPLEAERHARLVVLYALYERFYQKKSIPGSDVCRWLRK